MSRFAIVSALIALSFFTFPICDPPQWLEAAAQQPPLSQLERQSGQTEPMPSAPPHVIVLRSDQGDVRRLSRDGWVREEHAFGDLSSIHMTAAGGFDYGVVLSAQGVPVSLELRRDVDARPAAGIRTGETDTVLGESCDVWIGAAQFDDGAFSGPVLTCLTADGVELWSGRRPPGTTALRIDVRAIALERRTPAWTEFSFPHEALDWAFWSSHSPLPPVTARPAYEIRFDAHIIRVRGDTRYEARGNGFSIRSRNMRLAYVAPGSHAALLSINAGPQQPYPHPLSGGSEPMARAPLHISGERCHWRRVDLAVRWGVVGACVTNDGIQFAESTDYFDPEHQDKLDVATYFRRGAPVAALMSPPADVFEPWIAALPH